MDKRKSIRTSFITVIFFLSLYFVEAGIAGSSVVATYNDGYGTLDMKQYNIQTVDEVLSRLNENGRSVYRWYYFFDFVFIVCFFAFQYSISKYLFPLCKTRKGTCIIMIIPLLRAIFDIIENIILLRALCTFPKLNDTWIEISSLCTNMKLWMVKLWVILLLVGFILCIIRKKQSKRGLMKR